MTCIIKLGYIKLLHCVMHCEQSRLALIIFEGALEREREGRGVLFKTFPNTLTISWNISIVTWIIVVKVA